MPRRFETHQRMIRTSALLLGVVPKAGALLLAINSDHHRVQVEDQSAGGLGHREQLSAQPIMHAHQLANVVRSQCFEKAPERGLIRKRIQPKQVKKGSVVLKDFGLVDSAQASDDGVQQGQKQISGPIRPLAHLETNISLKAPAQAELLAKAQGKKGEIWCSANSSLAGANLPKGNFAILGPKNQAFYEIEASFRAFSGFNSLHLFSLLRIPAKEWIF